MKLKVSCDLTYDFPLETDVIASIHAATSEDQTVLSESLTVTPPTALVMDAADARGERRFRAALSGEVRITYEAVVDNGQHDTLAASARQARWTALPQDVLQYLTASRYCPADRFSRFAQRKFGHIADGGARVLAISAWVAANVDYVAGVSTSETTAEQTFIDRAGVCRDFSHLGITLCRALGIPARAVSAYAWRLEPPDFHAVMDVFLDGRWWLVDPTQLASVDALVRIGVGRDAGDIAFLTTSGACERIAQTVAVQRLDLALGPVL